MMEPEKEIKGGYPMNCPKCGNSIPEHADYCENCGQIIAAQPVQPEVPQKKPENVLTGTVGALIGAAIGGVSIILLSQLGIVSAISGLILAVCTLKGYELLGGQMSLKGVLICVVLMLVTPYVADRIDWAIVLLSEFPDAGLSFGEAFAMIPMLIEEEAIELSSYLINLLMLYGFCALGAFSTVYSQFKKK